MMKILFACQLLALVNGATPPAAGVYNAASVMKLWVSQLTLRDDGTADFEFLLNSAGSKEAKLPFPRLFQLQNLSYTWNPSTSELVFLDNPSDCERDEVVAMIDFFKPLGTFPVPVVTTVRDQIIAAKILVVTAEMAKQDVKIDMAAKLIQFQKVPHGKSTSAPSAPPTAALGAQATATTKSAALLSAAHFLVLAAIW